MADYTPNRHTSLIAQALAHAQSKQVAPGNIDLSKRQVVINPDRSFSTEQSISFQDENGFEVVIPTVVNGQHLSPEQAIDHYYRTGQQLGVFSKPQDANWFAGNLHKSQERKYSAIANALMENGSGNALGAPPKPQGLMRSPPPIPAPLPWWRKP